MINDQLNSKLKSQDSKLFGLIGYPLAHSFSKKYFTEKFKKEKISDCLYENFPLHSIEEFPSLIESHPDLLGLNVTIPYKEQVISFLDELDETSGKIGAVNTIKISQGKLTGHNTDVYGFMNSIKDLLQPFHSSALILGTGGGAKAVAFGLMKMGIEFDFVSRNPDEKELRYEDLDEAVIHQYKIIINTTPVGMFPDIDSCPPIPYELLTSSHLLFDLIYNPDETLFLMKGKQQGATVKNGLEMLQLQAERSWEIWNS
ncbi:MAG: shikimate dehydrogenase family protein [Chitinophagales bacterium]